MEMTVSTPKRVYRLNEGVRVFSTNNEEIRFRKGIWNFNEAVLRLAGQDESAVAFLRAVAEELIRDGTTDIGKLAVAQGVDAAELDELCEILENLQQQQFLAP